MKLKVIVSGQKKCKELAVSDIQRMQFVTTPNRKGKKTILRKAKK